MPKVGKAFLNIEGHDPDNKSPKYLKKKLGEEIAPGVWQKEEPHVFSRNSAGDLVGVTALSEHMERADEIQDARQGVVEAEPVRPLSPNVTWTAIHSLHREWVANMCETFKKPPSEWPTMIPFNPMQTIPVTHDNHPYYTFSPPADHDLSWDHPEVGEPWVTKTVGFSILAGIAREHNLQVTELLTQIPN